MQNPPSPRRTAWASGDFGVAWSCDLEATRALPGSNPADSQISAFVVHAPNSHPLWPTVIVSMIHLRPIPDTPDVTFNFPGATHEIIVLAFDPNSNIEAVIDAEVPTGTFLSPANFAAQIVAKDDAEAIERCEDAVRRVLDGRLNPDTDGREEWFALFGRNAEKLAYREPATGTVQ